MIARCQRGNHNECHAKNRRVGGGDLTATENAAIYLTRFEQHTAFIDSGCANAHGWLVEKIMPSVFFKLIFFRSLLIKALVLLTALLLCC